MWWNWHLQALFWVGVSQFFGRWPPFLHFLLWGHRVSDFRATFRTQAVENFLVVDLFSYHTFPSLVPESLSFSRHFQNTRSLSAGSLKWKHGEKSHEIYQWECNYWTTHWLGQTKPSKIRYHSWWSQQPRLDFSSLGINQTRIGCHGTLWVWIYIFINQSYICKNMFQV